MERNGDWETDSLETGFMISTIIRETLPKTFREVFPHFTVKYLFTLLLARNNTSSSPMRERGTTGTL